MEQQITNRGKKKKKKKKRRDNTPNLKNHPDASTERTAQSETIPTTV